MKLSETGSKVVKGVKSVLFGMVMTLAGVGCAVLSFCGAPRLMIGIGVGILMFGMVYIGDGIWKIDNALKGVE